MRRMMALVVLALLMTCWNVAYAGGGDYPPISDSIGGKTLALAAVPPGSVSPTPQVYLWQYGRQPVQITHSQYWVTHPRFSPDGRRLAVNDGNQVVIIDLVSGRARVIVPGPRKFIGDWSPDGRFLCFMALRWVPEWDDYGQPRVWYVDVRTKRTFQVPDHGVGQRYPTWGPDGTIAFEEGNEVPSSGVKGYNPYTGEESILVPTAGEYGELGAGDPVWTPQGDTYYSNWPSYTDTNKIFLVNSEDIPGRGTPVTHNLWEWGEDIPELATGEGDFFYRSYGENAYTTYHFMRDRFGTLWALDHIIGLDYWTGSITITDTIRLHERWWRTKPSQRFLSRR